MKRSESSKNTMTQHREAKKIKEELKMHFEKNEVKNKAQDQETEEKEGENNRIIIYEEMVKGKKLHHRLNLNSPCTREAVARLGVSLEDCVLKPMSEFLSPGVDPRIAEKMFKHHSQKVQDTLKLLYKIRKFLIEQNAIQYNSFRKKSLLVPSNKRRNFSSDNLSQILNKKISVTPQNEKCYLEPIEKKRVMDIIEKKLKELLCCFV